MKEHFVIRGKRDFIVNKVADEYIGYDRLDLEYYSFDEIGAEILYCISKNFSLPYCKMKCNTKDMFI